MSDKDICPKCGHGWHLHNANGCFSCDCHNGLFAEIARLKAALERSESAFRGMVEIKDEIAAERDDARKLARHFYRRTLSQADMELELEYE